MSKPIISKRCSKCKQTKSFSEFYKDRTIKDGHRSHCKICCSQYQKSEEGKTVQKRYEQSEKGKTNKKAYQQNKTGKFIISNIQLRYRINHPKRIKARMALNVAVRSGHLPKPKSLQCSCGNQAQQYHHYLGYAPEHQLDVVPMCRLCDKKAHKQSQY